MAYSRDYPNSIIPKGSKVVECLQNDDKELKRILGILSDIGVMSLFGSKRQCVLHAATGTDGKPSYLTANGLNVAINGSTTPVIVTFAGGYNANGTVDKTDTIVDTVNAWTMPANGTYYLYIDKDMSTGILSYGYTTIPDTYKTTAPESPTLDQCYFNTVDMKMYHYNSSAWEQKLRVFVAKAVTTADTATLTIYPFTSRTTASNFIQYDGNGNLQAVDLVGALTQFSASKFIGALHGTADTATKALAADKCTGNADTATKATNDGNGSNIADTYFPKSGGTISGNVTANEFYANGWFRSYGDIGWYSQTHEGGWHMTDKDWVRSYCNKGVYTGGQMKADGGFIGNLHGTADNAKLAVNAQYIGNDTVNMAFHWAGKGGQPTWLWGSPDDNANNYVYNPVNFNVNSSQYIRPLSGDTNYKLAYTADGQRTNAGEWGRVVMRYDPNGQTYGVRCDRADYADSAGAVNGWNVDSFKRNLCGRNQPSLTSILDGCYDGNGNKIKKTVNSSTGVSGYGTGDIHLTQSYKNFDKIFVVHANDNTNYESYTLWDTWQLAYAFSHGWRFGITNGANSGGDWNVFAAVQAGTQTHELSTDTIWYLSDENSVLVDIIGVNY